MGHDRREPKRARQACLNCRRKKARCSGEKPVCAFCARLNQACEWDNTSSTEYVTEQTSTRRPSMRQPSETALAARVALLEAKLSLLNDDTMEALAACSTTTPRPGLVRQHSSKRGRSVAVEPVPTASHEPLYSTLPDRDIQRHLIDVYFENNHNQPYSYFHEATFRRKFDDDCVPEHLMLAVVATACRFSDLELFRDRHREAMNEYASISWQQIYEDSFSHDAKLEFSMVQATSMLSVIEFTSGLTRLGWVKFSLTIRFAQGLRLNEEPDESLPVYDQEERRRTFWSVYLMDVHISLGPNRPPSLLDADCTVVLPCHEDLFRNGLISDFEPTLQAVIEHPTAPGHQNLDYFATTVLMASALGRFIRLGRARATAWSYPLTCADRFALKRSPRTQYVMWDPRSPYHDVHSILLHFESLSPCPLSTVTETLQYQFTFDCQVDKQRAGHFLYSHAIYHTTHCLLNHPFIFHHILRQTTAQVPPSFIIEGLARCHKHATELLRMLQDAEQYGRLVQSSFYGYCAMLAGIVHRLYESHEDPGIASASRDRARAALDFLEAKPVRWPIFNNMAHLLRYFKPDIETAKALTSAVSLSQKIAIKDGHVLWQLLDYARVPEMNPLAHNWNTTTPSALHTITGQPSTYSAEENLGASGSHYSHRSSGYFPEVCPEASEGAGVWSPFLPNEEEASSMQPPR